MKKCLIAFALLLACAVSFAADKKFDDLIKEGVKYLDDSKYNKSMPLFKKAIEMEPNNYLVNYYIGRNYQYIRQFDKAMEHLKAATKLNPKHADSHCYYGYAMASKGDELENSGVVGKAKGINMKYKAKKPMDEALKIDPKNACANTGLARADIFFKKWADAEKKLKTALQSDPERTTAMIYLGWAYYGLKKTKDGDTWLQKAAKLVPASDAWAFYTIGEIYSDFGEWMKALPYIEKALKIQPGYEGEKGKKLLEEARKNAKAK